MPVKLVDGEPMLALAIAVGATQDLGETGGRRKRSIPFVGGNVRGDDPGFVSPGGGACQTIDSDGTIELAARNTLEPDGERVQFESKAIRCGVREVLARLAAGEPVPGGAHYFRTLLRLGGRRRTTELPRLPTRPRHRRAACIERPAAWAPESLTERP